MATITTATYQEIDSNGIAGGVLPGDFELDAGADNIFSVNENANYISFFQGQPFDSGVAVYKGVTPNGNPVFTISNFTYVFHINSSEVEGQEVTYSATPLAIPCFLRGTLIATEEGEIPVEDLAIGTPVKTMDGCFKPVTWVGKRSYLRLFTPLNRRNAVMPIRIAAGALADGVPARDLHVSPKHALLLDGHLIAPELLVNGTTIARMDLERVDYFHVKLEAHDVIFAEGTPAETYVVHGNLKSFNNWAEHEAIFGPVEDDPAAVDYAPRLRKGEALDRIRETIAARAAALGHGIAKAG